MFNYCNLGDFHKRRIISLTCTPNSGFPNIFKYQIALVQTKCGSLLVLVHSVGLKVYYEWRMKFFLLPKHDNRLILVFSFAILRIKITFFVCLFHLASLFPVYTQTCTIFTKESEKNQFSHHSASGTVTEERSA
jgi:hypothetical protein